MAYNPNKFLLKIPKKPCKEAKLSLSLVMAKGREYDELDRSRWEQLDKLASMKKRKDKIRDYSNY